MVYIQDELKGPSLRVEDAHATISLRYANDVGLVQGNHPGSTNLAGPWGLVVVSEEVEPGLEALDNFGENESPSSS
jgi:hypothetical protein